MEDGIKDGQEKAAQLINDLQDISLSKIGLIVLGTWIAIALARRVLPYLAEKGPSQLRLYLLGAVPIIRLLLLVVAILWLIPIIFNITFQNFLVISGAASVATPGLQGLGTLRQGYLEESSVDPVREITELIKAQRGYELNAKVITAADQMLGATVQVR